MNGASALLLDRNSPHHRSSNIYWFIDVSFIRGRDSVVVSVKIRFWVRSRVLAIYTVQGIHVVKESELQIRFIVYVVVYHDLCVHKVFVGVIDCVWRLHWLHGLRPRSWSLWSPPGCISETCLWGHSITLMKDWMKMVCTFFSNYDDDMQSLSRCSLSFLTDRSRVTEIACSLVSGPD